MTVTTDNSQTLVNALVEIERLNDRLLMAEAILAGNGALITGLKAEVARLEPMQYRQAPCHKFCESTAYEIEARGLKAEIARLTAENTGIIAANGGPYFSHYQSALGKIATLEGRIKYERERRANVCNWSLYDDESGTWQSGCGELWSFIDAGPNENRVSYCHHCGGKVHIKAAT